MSKITFRADDDLIRQLEEFDASKSEVMREALREYLNEAGNGRSPSRTESVDRETTDDGSLDALIAERVDAIIDDRLNHAFTRRQPQDVNVNISLDGNSGTTTAVQADADSESTDASHDPSNDASHATETRKTADGDAENTDANARKTCAQCGDEVDSQHVYCPNCGEKTSRRVFCECGDELRSDWGFCPSCGRRTPAADVLENT